MKGSILCGSASINLLEFLKMDVNVLLECLEADTQDCILTIGDNTSTAISWLHNSSRLKLSTHEAHLMVVRHMTLTAVLNMNCHLASQHSEGDLNTVADLLLFLATITRAGGKKDPIAIEEPLNDILTQRLPVYYPEQILANFKIAHSYPAEFPLGFSSSNRCIVFNSPKEESNESHGRTW